MRNSNGMNLKSDEVVIFTDGSSRGNPGPGGFGAVLILPSQNEKNYELGIRNYGVREIGGREAHTTNNRMELQAAISALSIIHNSSFTIRVHTDSSYLLNGITRWIHGWQKNGWKTGARKDVENRDLWEQLIDVSKGKDIQWKLVKGHAGVAGNTRCDEIATAFADGEKLKLYAGILKNYRIENILEVPSRTEEGSTLNLEKGRTLGSSAGKRRSRQTAYSYVSMVDGIIQTHKTWAECEVRIKGARGARYKKSLTAEEERTILSEFSKT